MFSFEALRNLLPSRIEEAIRTLNRATIREGGDAIAEGRDTIQGLRANPEARTIVLSTYSGDVQVVRALKAGARAYLLKGSVNQELLATIRAYMRGTSGFPPSWLPVWPNIPEKTS